MISKMLIAMGTLGLLVCSTSYCVAQPQEVLENIGGGLQAGRPSTSIANIRKAMELPFVSKEFHEKKEFGEFLKKLGNAISKKGKEVQFVIDHEAFMANNKKDLRIAEEEVVLPVVPSKIVAFTALRLALSQVGEGKADFWLRSGQIVITSNKRTRSSHFLKTASVGGTFKNRPLIDVLDNMAEQTGVSIIVDERVRKKAQMKVNGKFYEDAFFGGAKLETAVRLLTESAGLKHVVVGNVFYVTSPANARDFKTETDFKMNDAVGGMAYKNRPLLEVIGKISSWVIDSRVKNKASIRVTANWINPVEADVALRLLTDMAGLRHVVVDGVVYITDATNAKKLMEEVP